MVGVTQLVGEAVHEYNVETDAGTGTPKQQQNVLLGIASWGAVGNRESLLDANVRLLMLVCDCVDTDAPVPN